MQATQPIDRLAALDILRGFALLGILTMNITLGLPGAARLVPTIAGGFSGANFAAWVVGFLLFDEKMITTFSMLFGAGILLIGAKVGSPGKLFLRRQLLLLAIGLLHAYLIWEGDILVPYALCGLAVYPFRNLPPRRLLVLAFVVWLPSLALASVFADQFNASPEAAQAFRPGPAEVARLIEVNRNSSVSVRPSPVLTAKGWICRASRPRA